jgi:hypothetical protein
MNSILRTFLLLALAHACSLSVTAQIRNDESSISVLAIQCSMSSGYPASGFPDYSTGLAKTLSLLDGDQQQRVFGYIPKPGSFSLAQAKKAATATASAAMASKGTPAAGSSIPGVDALTAMVGSVNQSLFGASDVPAPVIAAGIPEVVEPVADVAADATGTTLAALADTAGNAAAKLGTTPVSAAKIVASPTVVTVEPTPSVVASNTTDQTVADLTVTDPTVTDSNVSGNDPLLAVSDNPTGSGTTSWDDFMAWLQGAADAYKLGGKTGLGTYLNP